MNTLEFVAAVLRIITLLASVHGGYVLSLVFNPTRELAWQELHPYAAFGFLLPVAFISGFYGSCFALEFVICFLLLLFGKYPLMLCLLPGCFSFFFRMIVFASWATSWDEFLLPRWTVAVLPFLGVAILAFMMWKRL